MFEFYCCVDDEVEFTLESPIFVSVYYLAHMFVKDFERFAYVPVANEESTIYLEDLLGLTAVIHIDTAILYAWVNDNGCLPEQLELF